MEIIDQLQSLSNRINEQQKFLNINNFNYHKSVHTLEEYCQSALLDLKQQLYAALAEETLPELKLAVPEEKITQILSINVKKKDYEAQREKIVEIMTALNNQRHELLRSNFALLDDFGKGFWRVCINPNASFDFETDKMKIRVDDEEYEVPYRRFTEPKEVILAEIAVDVRKMKLKERIHDHEKEIEALNVKLTELEDSVSIQGNLSVKEQSNL